MKNKHIPGLPTKEAQETYKRAIKAAEFDPADFMTLGRLMKKLEDQDEVLLAQLMRNLPGFNGRTRRVRYYLTVVKAFDGLVPDDKLQRVGWTKLAALAEHEHPNSTNVYDLLDKARERNVRQLRAFLKGDSGLSETKGVTLYFDSDQRPRFDKFIEQYGAIPQPGGGHTNREAALMKALEKPSGNPLN